MMQSFGAVVIGYLVFSISAVLLFSISGRPAEAWPGTSFAVFSTLYGAAFAMLAGFLAARLAPRAPLVHASVVSGLLAVAAIASMMFQAGETSPWSQAATLLIFTPSAFLGGFVQQRQSGSRQQTLA
jgi:hypothetical protein